MSTAPELDDSTAPPVDGRTARAVRTRERIVDACIALIQEGDVRPTAPRIAERAEVSVRSIFQHFDDLETLFRAVGDRVTEHVVDLIAPIDPAGQLDQRIDSFVQQSCRVNEVLSPINQAALVFAPGSPVITKQFEDGHRFLREQVQAAFEPELASAGDGRTVLVDGLVVALSLSTWRMLRLQDHRSVDRTRATVGHLVRLAFRGAGLEPDPPS